MHRGADLLENILGVRITIIGRELISRAVFCAGYESDPGIENIPVRTVGIISDGEHMHGLRKRPRKDVCSPDPDRRCIKTGSHGADESAPPAGDYSCLELKKLVCIRAALVRYEYPAGIDPLCGHDNRIWRHRRRDLRHRNGCYRRSFGRPYAAGRKAITSRRRYSSGAREGCQTRPRPPPRHL